MYSALGVTIDSINPQCIVPSLTMGIFSLPAFSL